jgi:hypothetical protein
MRIESLVLAFCGLVLLILVMRPGTETFIGRIFPGWLKAPLTSSLQSLFVSLMLFGILGVFSRSGVHLIPRFPIVFLVVLVLGTIFFLWANSADSGLNTAVWPPDSTRRTSGRSSNLP